GQLRPRRDAREAPERPGAEGAPPALLRAARGPRPRAGCARGGGAGGAAPRARGAGREAPREPGAQRPREADGGGVSVAGLRLRELLFGNWRNKGVALFFSLIIWFVAFRAETQEGKVPVSLVTVPRPENQVIIRQEVVEQGNFLPFDRTVELTVTGPRKQIEKLREDSRLREVRFPVE